MQPSFTSPKVGISNDDVEQEDEEEPEEELPDDVDPECVEEKALPLAHDPDDERELRECSTSLSSVVHGVRGSLSSDLG